MKQPPQLLVDAHVHYHACFTIDRFLDGAAYNFAAGARQLGLNRPWLGCLLLTETAGVGWFRRLRDAAGDAEAAGGHDTGDHRTDRWRIRATGDDESLLAEHDDGEKVLLVAGRQIGARGGLEVLALGRDEDYSEGLPLADAVAAALDAGALPVIPWGFGKWWRSRGKQVEALLRSALGRSVFLGDNGNRPRWALRPRLFDVATSLGVAILPGSDPLPFAAQCGNAGRYGFHLDPAPVLDPPAASLREAVRGLRQHPVAFGRREGLLRFGRFQLGMQLAKRREAG